MSWPGFARKVSEICELLGMPDVNNVIVSKTEVKTVILKQHYKDMVDIINTKSKLVAIKGYDFEEVQDYCNDKSVASF